MGKHDFSVDQDVQFTNEAKAIFHGDPSYNGTFRITQVAAVPQTCNDPFSPDYMGEMEGQDAVGHHQSVKLDGHDGWVSGALIEPVVAQLVA